MRGKVHGIFHLAGEKRVRVTVVQRHDAVRHSETAVETVEFIRVPARLKAETPDHVERNVLAQHRYIEFPRLYRRFPRIVRLIDGDCHFAGIGRYLHEGVIDHAVVLCAVVRGDHVQPVPYLVKRFFIHFFLSFRFFPDFRRNRPRKFAQKRAVARFTANISFALE